MQASLPWSGQAARLEVQQQELAEAAAAFKEASERWAPGMGAGRFLAQAVGRATLQVTAALDLTQHSCLCV